MIRTRSAPLLAAHQVVHAQQAIFADHLRTDTGASLKLGDHTLQKKGSFGFPTKQPKKGTLKKRHAHTLTNPSTGKGVLFGIALTQLKVSS